MLFASGAVPKVAVVGKIYQQIRAALDEFADLAGKHRFVADERAEFVIVQRKHNHAIARDKVTSLLRDAIHESEKLGYVLAERNQVDFVVAIHETAIRTQQHGRVERCAFLPIGDRSKQEIGMREARQIGCFLM